MSPPAPDPDMTLTLHLALTLYPTPPDPDPDRTLPLPVRSPPGGSVEKLLTVNSRPGVAILTLSRKRGLCVQVAWTAVLTPSRQVSTAAIWLRRAGWTAPRE